MRLLWILLYLVYVAQAAKQLTVLEKATAWAMKGTHSYDAICDRIYEQRQVEDGPTNAERPTKGTISGLFKKKKKKKKKRKKAGFGGPGRPPKTTPKEDKKLIRVVKKLNKANTRNDVTARHVNEEWDTEKGVSDATVSRRLRDAGRGWKKCKDQIVLSPEDKELRVDFSHTMKSKPVEFWQTKVAFLDEKIFRFYNSKNGKTVARTAKKTGGYFSAQEMEDQVPGTVKSSTKKNRQGYTPVRCAAVMGGGFVRSCLF